MFHTFSIEFASSYPPSLEAVAEEMEEADARDQCLQQLALAALRSAADGGGVDLSGQLFHHYSLHVVHQIHLNALLRETYRVGFYVQHQCFPPAERNGRRRWRHSPWWKYRRHVPRLVAALVDALSRPLRAAGFSVIPYRDVGETAITGFSVWLCSPETAPTPAVRAAIADQERRALLVGQEPDEVAVWL